MWGQAPLGGEGSWDSLSRVVSSVGLGLAVSHGGSDISGGGGERSRHFREASPNTWNCLSSLYTPMSLSLQCPTG